ncbi:MAG TPA: SDR family oxidoreductase [Afifellaceae bacterium]|nr:SDR family oxidoreductase [Afifellaceae bacterium]
MAIETSPRTALITGGARRIGRTIVRDLAAHGWAVAIHCNRSVAEAETEAQAIRQAGGTAAIIQADLENADATATILLQANEEIGPIDLLVNNASTFVEDRFGSLDMQIWRRQFAVNLEAPIFLAEAFAVQLPDGAEGNIVNLIDQRVWKLNPHMPSYTLSKAALWTATQTMAQSFAPRIRVNGIGPGPTFPNPRDGEAGLDREASGILLERRVDPADIATAVRFLVDTPSITGQMLAVDGGQHLAWKTPDIVESDS